jgi:hypothetical protein
MAESWFNDGFLPLLYKVLRGIMIVHPELECVWKEGSVVHFNPVKRVKLL